MILPKEKLTGLNPAFVETLTRIAAKLDFTLYITEGDLPGTSAAPPPSVGSHVKDTEHLDGLAVDVRVNGGWERYSLVKAALEEGVKRIGTYNAHVHLGASTTLPSPVLWVGISK